jgi:hypothetical protein
MMIHVPNRMIRYAVITNYAVRDAIKDIDVDLSNVESTMSGHLTRVEDVLQSTLDDLAAKVQSVIDRLERLEEDTLHEQDEEKDRRAGARQRRSKQKDR